MKIKEVKISNLMSFPYVENLDEINGINFEKPDGNLDMNILIGANGSGKSNFIEIINQFTKNIVLDYTFNKDIINQGNKSEFKNAIQYIPKPASKLSKHTRFLDKPSSSEFVIELFDNDYSNIEFISENNEKINDIIEKYSELPYRFPSFNINRIKDEIKEIHIKTKFDEKTQNFIVDKNSLSDMELFCLICIQEKELLYICMYIYNKREKKPEESFRYPLNNTFTILSSKRDLVERKYLNNFQDFDDFIFKRNDEINQDLEGYYKCLWKIWNIIKKHTKDDYEGFDDNSAVELKDSREKRLYNSTFWKRLSKYVDKFIHKTLTIEYIQGGINLQLKDYNGEPCYFDDLGAGQQSILLIIFSLLGNDLKDGFMIIDEPEIHIHPQLQKELAILLNQISKIRGTQFFLSTYSALFINENNITNVYRFSKENGGTKVFTPHIKIASDDAALVHLLRFENLSKIFFVNKIIMVEGDSDLYFFSHYLKWLQEQPDWEYITGTYEIININGKGSYKVWHKFLNKFGIENYFIGDRDNTVDYGFFTPRELGKYYQLANKRIKNYDKISTGDYYNRLVYTIKKFYPQKYHRIITGIEDLYKDNVYILKLGAIESYPLLERKGLQYMVNFCNLEFSHWLVSQQTTEQRKELLDIFGNIFSKSKIEEISRKENPF